MFVYKLLHIYIRVSYGKKYVIRFQGVGSLEYISGHKASIASGNF